MTHRNQERRKIVIGSEEIPQSQVTSSSPVVFACCGLWQTIKVGYHYGGKVGVSWLPFSFSGSLKRAWSSCGRCGQNCCYYHSFSLILICSRHLLKYSEPCKKFKSCASHWGKCFLTRTTSTVYTQLKSITILLQLGSCVHMFISSDNIVITKVVAVIWECKIKVFLKAIPAGHSGNWHLFVRCLGRCRLDLESLIE